MTAAEFLGFHGELLGMEGRTLRARREQLLERVGLTPFRNKQLRTFSKGMLQRIGLAQALMNHPALVFLDEPTSGLDPVGRRLVRDVVHELRNEGTCVFLNSHLLSEIEVTCDRVAFIRHGEVVRILDLASLKGDQSVVSIRATGLTPEMASEMARWGSDIQFNDEQLTLTVHNESSIPEINRYLVTQGANVFAISPSQVSLEDIFIETVGKDGGL
jgi:ABC-2 type transport system ATP-binding protein